MTDLLTKTNDQLFLSILYYIKLNIHYVESVSLKKQFFTTEDDAGVTRPRFHA